jgi:multidrug efflux pump subunit AcrB
MDQEADKDRTQETGDWRPRPDPSKLTTEQLYREVASIDGKIAGLKEIVFTRLSGMDKALDLSTEGLNRQPTAIDKAVDHLKDALSARMNGMDALREQKFAEIQMQFHEQSRRFDVTTQASKEAVEKALASAKEAIAEQNRASDLATTKSETNFTKQIDQQGTIIQNQAKNNDVQVGDIKERLNKLEGMALGKFDTEKAHRDNTSLYIALIAALIAAIGLFIANYHKL